MEILSKIVEYTIEPIGRLLGRQLCYVIHCRANIQKLQDRVQQLEAARETIENEVADAETKGGKIRPDVRLWLKKVGEITTKTDALLDKESQAKLKCLHGFCPNLTSRHQLGRESTKLVQEVVEQIEKGGFPQVSYGILRKEVWTVTNGDYQAFQSRIPIVKKIMDGLKDCEIQRMGVCGVGGVGKTTLVKDVYKQASEDKTLFDNVVILIDVKKEPNPEAIQKKIVEQLGMDLIPDETIVGRASRLCAKIQGKKVLVILDDIQEKIDLEVLGLARRSTCKILMTSRTPKVFSVDEMDAQENVFPLDLLVEEETWSLFKRMAGDVLEQNDGVRDVAIKIAKKCGGLPLLVVTVARALKGKKKLQAWKDALRRLSSFDKEESTKKAYLALEWSYDQLDGKELKPVFLLCGLIVCKNHICLLNLFKYGMGLGLFKDLHTMEEAQDAMDTLVDKLKDSCLLLDSDSAFSAFPAGYVRMHDLVCDVAKWIAHKDHFVLSVEYGGELKKWPDNDFMKKCTKISLLHINIPPLSELPLECPELEMFCLGLEDESVVIPSNFFSKMQELKVLALSNMDMPSLPSSLQYLKTLQTLCLDGCKLGDITLLGQLSSLEILSLMSSNIDELPREIGQLTRLRLLDLSECSLLKVIPHGVISSLVRLEDLRMRNSFNRWEIEGNASLSELKHLSQLYALEIHILNADILPANLFSHKIEKYNVIIGDTWKYTGKYPSWYPMDRVTLNTLQLRLTNKNTMGSDEGLKWLLKRSEDLSLDERVINVIKHLDAEDLKNLKHLRLENSTDYNMNKVVFSKLVTFVVRGCDNLRALLSVSMARSLVHLTQLNISSCKLIQEIISSPRDGCEEKDGILPRLQVLELNHLPKLVRFTTGNHIEFSALEELKIEDCYELVEFIWDNKVAMTNEDGRVGKEFGARVKEEEENLDVKSNTAVQYILFDKKVGFPSLERLSIKGTSLKALWHAQLAPDSFRRLKQVVVWSCDKLISLFWSSLMGKLNALETLEINSCKSLEVIFEIHGRSKVEEIHVDTLVPHDQWKPFDCQNLDSVKITWCESLKQIFPASVATCLQNLTQLEVKGCPVLKEIIVEEEEREGAETISPYFVFPKLTWVYLWAVPQLSSLYPKTHVSHWPLLEYLDMEECDKRRTFATESSISQNILVGGRGFFSINLNQDSFPQLGQLYLRDMDIWNGPPPAIGSVFGKLKSISFYGNCASFSNQDTFLFLQRLPNLEKIEVSRNDSCEEIFSRSGNEIHDDNNDAVRTGALPRVTTLTLKKLEKLIHLGNDDPRSLVFPNLETLQVIWCDGLKSIESSAISFRNLTCLEVECCDGLAYLTSYSVAKSFVQLTTLKVEQCHSIVIIVSSNEDDDTDAVEGNEIPFGRLQHLELNGLRSLQGFYTGNCTLKFPPAITLKVEGCPIKLKISSNGVLLTEIDDEFEQSTDVDDDHDECKDDANNDDGKNGVETMLSSTPLMYVAADLNLDQDMLAQSCRLNFKGQVLKCSSCSCICGGKCRAFSVWCVLYISFLDYAFP